MTALTSPSPAITAPSIRGGLLAMELVLSDDDSSRIVPIDTNVVLRASTPPR
ncbi:hypothetical protein ACIGPN_01250 [Streptomyces afghaniensis]|uniref:hypothetical protein n=1 Tax=Streptomyces afghaniensis TaxID=66865 RepID=UPI0037D0291F